MSNLPEVRFTKILDRDTHERMQIMQEAATAAAARSRALDLPGIHWVDGRILYELPDGTMTHEEPARMRYARIHGKPMPTEEQP